MRSSDDSATVVLRVTRRSGQPWLEARRGNGATAADPLPHEIGDLALTVETETLVAQLEDPAWSGAEDAFGTELTRRLRSAPGPWDTVTRALGAERGPYVVVDAEEPAIAALAWELLVDPAAGVAIETRGSSVIARLAGGRPRAPVPRGRSHQIAVWTPTPDDPSCAEHLSVLRAVGPKVIEVAGEPPNEPFVLHVVCHGAISDDTVVLLAGATVAAAGSVQHALSRWCQAAALIVLDVCEGGAPTGEARDSLAKRVLLGGARACVAPVVACNVACAGAFARGLHAALARGDALGAAVAEGRRAVRGLLLGAADSRWHNHVLVVADADVLSRPLVARRATTSELLGEARRIAQDGGARHVGIEHLLLAVRALPADGPIAMRLAAATVDVAPLLAQAESLVWAGEGPVVPTPRLDRLLDGAPSVQALLERLLADRWHRLHDAAPGLVVSATDLLLLTATDGETIAELGLEVLGGPADGRRFPLDGTFGAPTAGVDHVLTGPGWSDPDLAGRPIRALGGNMVDLPARTVLQRGTQRIRVAGPTRVLLGDAVRLTAATRVRIVSRDDW